MKFYFPDSQDMISPTYDFMHDEYSAYRVRQRDDKYAHEVLSPLPYDGLLVSKAIVDGTASGGAGKYSGPQRERLYRLGVRDFFRLPDAIDTLGDCGAFTYINDPLPPYTVDEVLDFYERCGFDAGVSVDHIVFGYDDGATEETVDPAWARRRQVSLQYANDFLRACTRRSTRVEPVGAAQGWSPASYADSVRQLSKMGYQQIALGGMVPLKTHDILACLREIASVEHGARLHLLGVTRVKDMTEFASLGVTSFDSTSPFRQAFMDDHDNYHTLTAGTYVAIRVPQVDANPALKRRILGGQVPQRDAVEAERQCLRLLRSYEVGGTAMDDVLSALDRYERVLGVAKSYVADYARTLTDRPWATCACSLCSEHGIEIAIFRGTERNKRRGFHNLAVFAERVHQLGLVKTNSRGNRG